MGQKVNPIGFRTGRMTGWKSRWFSDSGVYKDLLLEDFAVRKELMKKLASAGIVGVEIERQPKSIVIIVTVSRPGIVIGRGGSGIEDLKKFIISILKSKHQKIDLKVNEVKKSRTICLFSCRKSCTGFGKKNSTQKVCNKINGKSNGCRSRRNQNCFGWSY